MTTYYTEAEAAERLNIPSDLLKNHRYRYKLKHIRFGKEVRYTQAHLDAYVQLMERGGECEADTGSSSDRTAPTGTYTGVNLASLDAAARGREIARRLK